MLVAGVMLTPFSLASFAAMVSIAVLGAALVASTLFAVTAKQPPAPGG